MSSRRMPLKSVNGVLVPARGNHIPRARINKKIDNKQKIKEQHDTSTNEHLKRDETATDRDGQRPSQTKDNPKKALVVEDRIIDVGEDDEDELQRLYPDDRADDLSGEELGYLPGDVTVTNPETRSTTRQGLQETEHSTDGNSLPVHSVSSGSRTRKSTNRKKSKSGDIKATTKAPRGRPRKNKKRGETGVS